MITLVLAVVLVLLAFTAGVALWNRYWRSQVFLVLDPSITWDTANSSPNKTPSNLAQLQSVAASLSAQVATFEQIQAYAKAGGEQLHWGWAMWPDNSGAPEAYVAAMATQDNRAQRVAAALQCSSQSGALVVDPCLAQVAAESAGQPACANDAAYTQNMQLTYDPKTNSVTSQLNDDTTFLCGSGVIADYPALGSGGYQYNPSGGVWLYGVKPPQGSDPRVQAFNALSSQYSQFGALAL